MDQMETMPLEFDEIPSLDDADLHLCLMHYVSFGDPNQYACFPLSNLKLITRITLPWNDALQRPRKMSGSNQKDGNPVCSDHEASESETQTNDEVP